MGGIMIYTDYILSGITKNVHQKKICMPLQHEKSLELINTWIQDNHPKHLDFLTEHLKHSGILDSTSKIDFSLKENLEEKKEVKNLEEKKEVLWESDIFSILKYKNNKNEMEKQFIILNNNFKESYIATNSLSTVYDTYVDSSSETIQNYELSSINDQKNIFSIIEFMKRFNASKKNNNEENKRDINECMQVVLKEMILPMKQSIFLDASSRALDLQKEQEKASFQEETRHGEYQLNFTLHTSVMNAFKHSFLNLICSWHQDILMASMRNLSK
jgi:hypothetical protein